MKAGFVFVDEAVPGIRWDAKYATWDNFTAKPWTDTWPSACCGQPDAARITARSDPAGGDPAELPRAYAGRLAAGAATNGRPGAAIVHVDAAYGTFEEDVKGSLARGKYADVVILSDDPTAVAVDSLVDIQVVATMVGGRFEHCAEQRTVLTWSALHLPPGRRR